MSEEEKPKAPDKFQMDKDAIVWTKPPKGDAVGERAKINRVLKLLKKKLSRT